MAIPLALLVAAATQAVAQSGIGYASVAEARRAVTALPGAKTSDQQGWLIVEQMPVMWSFAPAGHEAYPAAIRRTVVRRDGRIDIDMSMLCEAPKPACDRLVQHAVASTSMANTHDGADNEAAWKSIVADARGFFVQAMVS